MMTPSKHTTDKALAEYFEQLETDDCFGFLSGANITTYPIPEGRKALRQALAFICQREGRDLIWLPEYDQVGDYLTKPKGKGLLLFGDFGRGKSLITTKAIPMLMHYFHRKIFQPTPAVEISDKNVKSYLNRQTLIVDDIGTEPMKIYGEQRSPISQIIDEAERSGHLLFMSTNLELVAGFADGSGRPKETIEERYGSRTYDRLIACCRLVEFRGESFRK